MKRILLFFAMALFSAMAWSASAPQQLPKALQGNWSSVDGAQQWVYGLHPAVAVWQNTFWGYAGISTKGAVTTIQLRERGGDRTATLYAHWSPKDSTAMIGLSPKSLIPYSRRLISNPNYRIPAAEDADYPGGDSILHDGTAVVRGYLDGYDPETMPRTVKIYSSNTFTWEALPAVADIAADGTFEASVSLGHPLTMQVVLAQVFYDDLYLEPGDTLVLGCNLSDKDAGRFMGTNGRVNREMNALRSLYAPFGGEQQMFVMRTTPDSLVQWVDDRIAFDSGATAKYIAENGISRKGAFLARWSPAVQEYQWLGLHAMFSKDPVDTAFYGFYRNLPMNDLRLLGTKNYASLINRLEFCPVYWDSNRQSVALQFSDLVREGYPIEAGDFLLIDSLERKLYSVAADTAATAKARTRIWKKLYEKYGTFFDMRNAVWNNGLFYTMGNAYWGRPMPMLNDLIAARRLHESYGRIGRNIPNLQLAPMIANFTLPYAVRTILDKNDALRPVPVAVATGPYVPSDRGERLLDSLLQQHRGRAVYVDFWSTGCGPCRQGMMESWEIKEKLDGKPVDFVYITSTDQSPEKAAADFIGKNKITGRQIRLTPDEWNILAAKYKINGIPHYMLVGPDGRVVNPDYRGYGDEIVRALLKAAGE